MDKILVDERRIKPKHWRIIVISLLSISAIVFFIFRDYSGSLKIDIDKLQIAEVLESEFEDYIKYNSRVEPISVIYLDAIEGGRVEEIYITEGSMLNKGDVILRLSNNQLNLSILDSEAQLAEKANFLREVMLNMEQQKLQTKRELIDLEYQLKKRKREYERNILLFEEKLIAEEEFLQSEDSYFLSKKLYSLMLEKRVQDSVYRTIQIEQMNTNLRNMQKNLDFVHQRLENLKIRVPFDGQLGLLDAEIGQSVSPGQRIGQINVLTSFKIVAEIDEHYIDRVETGLFATMERNDKKYELKIKKVYPEVRNGRFQVDLVFVGEMPEGIRTGQTYYVDIQLGDAKICTLIPRGSFFQATGGQWIFVLDKTQTYATKRKINIGRQNSQYFEVLEGIFPGEKVIISDYEAFGDNDKIILKQI